MVGPVEPNHLNGKGLRPIIGRIPEGDGQIDLPKWYGLLSRHDAVERCSGRSDARSIDAHGVEHFGLHDVEATASIHQYLGEPLHADDRVNHERISPWLGDALRVVGLIKGYGGLRPPKEDRRGWFGHIDLMARELLATLGVVGR